MRRVAAFLLTVFLLLFAISAYAAPATEKAPDSGIQLSVQLGIGGRYVPNLPTRAVVDIQNPGPALEATLQMDVTADNMEYIRYEQRVSLPENSAKRVHMEIAPGQNPSDFPVRLVAADGTVLVDIKPLTLEERLAGKVSPMQKAVQLPYDQWLVGVLTQDPASVRYMTTRAQPRANPTIYEHLTTTADVVILPPADFPESARELSALGMLIVDHFDLRLLTPEQQRAFSDWLSEGGTLIVGTGARAGETLPACAAYTSVTANGTAQLAADANAFSDLSGSNPGAALTIANLTVPTGVAVAKDDAGATLAIYEPYGRGMVFVSAFELGETTYAGWAGAKVFTFSLPTLALSPSEFARYTLRERSYDNSNYGVMDALKQLPISGMPNILGMLIVLLALALLPVPCYFVLRARRKQHLLWAILPACALAALLITVPMGLGTHANQPLATTISILSPDADQPINTYALFSRPGSAESVYSVGAGVSLQPMPDYGNYYYSPNESERLSAIVRQGTQTEYVVPARTSFALRAAALHMNERTRQALDIKLYPEGDSIRGTVTNLTQEPLYDVAVTSKVGYQVVERILPGETVAVDVSKQSVPVSAAQPASSYMMYRDGFQMYIDSVYDQSLLHSEDNKKRWSAASEDERLFILEQKSHALIASLVLNDRYYGNVKDVYVIAFGGNVGKPELLLDGKPIERRKHLTAYRKGIMLPHIDGEGNLFIPAGMLSATMPPDKNMQVADYGSGVFEVMDGMAELTFIVEEAAICTVEELTLDIGAYSEPSIMEIFNAKTEQWEPLAQQKVTYTGEQVYRYMQGNGAVRFRINHDAAQAAFDPLQGNTSLYLWPTLSVKGKVK